MRSSRITMKDIAEACGCTVNTVSRALRNDPKLSEATRSRVQESAVRLGYIRNSLASSLRSGKSHTVAVIVNDLRNLHFCNMLSRMDTALRAEGYNMMVLCMLLDEALGEEMIHTAISMSVDGILYFPYHNNHAHIEYMEKNHVPFVLLDRWIQNVITDSVRCDDVQGGYLAGSHLAALGHRRFLFLSGVNQSSSQIDRLAGFQMSLDRSGIPRDQVRIVPGEAVEEALAANRLDQVMFPVDYTAVVSFRDEVSYPAMQALQSRGLSIPEDISIVSFDHLRGDMPYLAPLTSIYAAEGSVAAQGVRLLMNRIAHPELPPQVEVLPVMLYDEGTTAPPRG